MRGTVTVLLVALSASALNAQSLAEVAKKEQERRAETPKAVRVFKAEGEPRVVSTQRQMASVQHPAADIAPGPPSAATSGDPCAQINQEVQNSKQAIEQLERSGGVLSREWKSRDRAHWQLFKDLQRCRQISK